MEIPADLKSITPYVQRGQELKKNDPIVSYYALYYAVKLAIAIESRTEEANAYLSHLLGDLEKQKECSGDNEAITNDLVGYAHVENFALKIFISADNEDRAGKASKKTAKTFLAASTLLEILKTFGELDTEIKDKIRYSRFKAADIMKAIREGRTPTPGPPGEEESSPAVNNAATDNEMDETVTPPPISGFPSPPSNFTAPLSPSQQQQPPPPTQHDSSNSDMPHFNTPPVQKPTTPPATAQQFPVSLPQAPATPVTPAPQPQQQPTATIVTQENVALAQKNCKWANSALEYDDIKTARLQLLSALKNLGFDANNNFGYE